MSLNSGERQVAPTLDGIRRDHVARYRWAARVIPAGSRVVDCGAGVGYGAAILHDAGNVVTAIERDVESLLYGAQHYAREGLTFANRDLASGNALGDGLFDVAVAFEIVEHLADPLPMLRELRAKCGALLVSVPNEAVFPHRGKVRFHHRHYTRAEFEALLGAAGWQAEQWLGQHGAESEVAPDAEGRTLIARCVPGEIKIGAPMQKAAKPDGSVGHVVILGLGGSVDMYLNTVKRFGGRRAFCDQVWAINALGDIVECDLIVHMDDVRIQEIRAAALPNSNIAVMVDWLKKHPGPILTSRAHPDYPGLVELPLEAMINDLGTCYFNNTGAYAVAYAIFKRATKITMFGLDYSYPNAHDAERGRACVEFWLGVASQRGIEIGIAEHSTLMDMNAPPAERLYGYDTLAVTIRQAPDGSARVDFTPRDTLPSASEIEARYDHSKHPNPLMRK